MNKNYVLENIRDFHLNQVLECGQCFRYARIDNGLNPGEYEYEIVAKDRILHIKEEPSDDGVTLIFYKSIKKNLDYLFLSSAPSFFSTSKIIFSNNSDTSSSVKVLSLFLNTNE